MRWPRKVKLPIGGSGHALTLGATVAAIARTFAWSDLLKTISQLNNGICAPTFFAADAIISDRLHSGLVRLNRGKESTDFRFFGVPNGAAGDVQRLVHATALATLTKRHSPLDFMESGRRTLRHNDLSRGHPPVPVPVDRIRRCIGLLLAAAASF